MLSRELPRDVALTLVDTGTRPVSPALTFDSDHHLHARANITELELIAQCDGNLSLGQSYWGWRGEGSDYFDAPSGKLPGINGIALHHLLLRAAHMRGEPEKLAELASSFRFPALAGLAGKLTHPSDDPQSPRSMLRTMINVDTEKYIDLLERKAREGRTIEYIAAKGPFRLERDADNRATAIIFPDGRKLPADIFIDMDGALDPRAKGTALTFDYILAAIDSGAGNSAFAEMHALDDAVMTAIPLRGKIARILAYDSARLSEDAARALLPQAADVHTQSAHFHSEPWRDNLVQAGSASGTLQSPAQGDIHLLHGQLCRLAELVPVSQDMHIEAREYNRLHGILYQQLADFHALAYLLNSREGESWQALRDTEKSKNLQIRLDQFQSRGRFVTFDGETHDEQRWIDMMIGFGIIPDRFDPMARAANMAQAGQALGRIVDAFKQTAAAMPTHAEYMTRLGALAQKEAPVDEFAI